MRSSEPTKGQLRRIKRKPIYIVCDNVLDTYNIGSIFRLADAVAASKVYLCGGSETPPNSRIAKASVGTDKWVPWQYATTAVEAIGDVRKLLDSSSTHSKNIVRAQSRTSLKVIAIEQHPKAKDFRKVNYKQSFSANKQSFSANKQSLRSSSLDKRGTAGLELLTMNHELAVAFVVGHETNGVSKEALALCDQIVEIPMYGVNISLNVMVSLAIVMYRTSE